MWCLGPLDHSQPAGAAVSQRPLELRGDVIILQQRPLKELLDGHPVPAVKA